jgi:hypothetical protein
MPRRFGLGLTDGDAVAIKGVEESADRLVTTTQWVGHLAGMAPTLAGQQDLAAAHGQTL